MSNDLKTKRAYLASLTGPDGSPLAKADGRGRFSHAAMAALAEAEKSGMTFAEVVPGTAAPKAPKAPRTVSFAKPLPSVKAVAVDSDYDAKEVRAWAAQVGLKVGERGRIHSATVAAYKAANGDTTAKPKPSISVIVNRPKVRPETVAWGFARRRPTEGRHISEPLVEIRKCSHCSDGIAFCRCSTGPLTPKWMGAEAAMLVKPTI